MVGPHGLNNITDCFQAQLKKLNEAVMHVVISLRSGFSMFAGFTFCNTLIGMHNL